MWAGQDYINHRSKCEKCSDTYSRDIALCFDHTKEYHNNMNKYP